MGREAFLREAAPAALVREAGPLSSRRSRQSAHAEAETTLVVGFEDALLRRSDDKAVDVYPLAKKPGAPFSDMITVGRTGNNDVVLDDVTVSRFHAYFKDSGGRWVVCDSGSKNGTSVEGNRLDARKEIRLDSGAEVKFGDVEATFYTAADLFDNLASADE